MLCLSIGPEVVVGGGGDWGGAGVCVCGGGTLILLAI